MTSSAIDPFWNLVPSGDSNGSLTFTVLMMAMNLWSAVFYGAPSLSQVVNENVRFTAQFFFSLF